MADNPISVPLPKDLPENWSDADYVSPGGVEVGLTAKHGFNYLMQQVNRAQTAADDLGNAFPNLAPSDPASTIKNGLMTKEDKIKLNGIEEGATKDLRGAGAPTTATVGKLGQHYFDTTGKKEYICTNATSPYTWVLSDTNTVTSINGKTGVIQKSDIVALGIPEQDTTYANATTSVDGLMSKDDKTKLDGVATGANNTTVVNNLTSTSTTSALSAAQGKALQDNKLDKTGGTLTGNLITNNPAIATAASRNIYAGTTDMEAGVSTLASGSIYFMYE
jgi:hypothetical protein